MENFFNRNFLKEESLSISFYPPSPSISPCNPFFLPKLFQSYWQSNTNAFSCLSHNNNDKQITDVGYISMRDIDASDGMCVINNYDGLIHHIYTLNSWNWFYKETYKVSISCDARARHRMIKGRKERRERKCIPPNN